MVLDQYVTSRDAASYAARTHDGLSTRGERGRRGVPWRSMREKERLGSDNGLMVLPVTDLKGASREERKREGSER